jgi:peptidyl-prolyl cis-trans isomerase SurA
MKPRCSRFFYAFAVLVCIAALAACQRKGSDVVARVNGKNIPRADLEKYYQSRIAADQQQAQQLDGPQSESIRLNVLNELVASEILMQRAEKLGLLATDDEVNQRLTEMRSPYTAEQFQKTLKDRGLTEDDLKRNIRVNLTEQKVFNKEVSSKINITDADISAYYNSHKSEFNLIEPQFHVAHIFVAVNGSPQTTNEKPHTQAEALQKIQSLYNRLQSGEDFEAVAKAYSEDPGTKNNGGDLGPMPELALRNTDMTTRDAVLKLKPGQYSGILAVTDPASKQLAGYRIVKLLSREPAGQRELSDPRVVQFVREQLQSGREQLLKAAYLEVVRNQAKVENYFAEDVLKKTAAR